MCVVEAEVRQAGEQEVRRMREENVVSAPLKDKSWQGSQMIDYWLSGVACF